ncbi:MAG TPA: 50S ribosomal protein L25 [candidate division Zixibacteria bacterium]|nr:50S ribosomal protein L25 [candidate division Zixibacteria bacterium]
MKILTLKANRREEVGKGESRRMRYTGAVPGVLYGRNLEPTFLKFNEHDLKQFLQKSGEHGMFQLQVEENKPVLTVLAEVQHHPVTDKILHIDFKQIPTDQPVELKVPLEFVGDSPGVQGGGLFMPRLYELDIKAMPDNVPDSIRVDISGLDFDNVIHISDVEVPEDIEVLHEDSQTVATVIKPRGLGAEEEGEEVEGEEVEGEEAEGEGEAEESAE